MQNIAAARLETGRFDNISLAVIISNLPTLLMMTVASMLLKRPVLRFTGALSFFLALFCLTFIPMFSIFQFGTSLQWIYFSDHFQRISCRSCGKSL